MIKTELKTKTKAKAKAKKPARRSTQAKRPSVYSLVIAGGIVIILAILGYSYFTGRHQQPPTRLTTRVNQASPLPVTKGNQSSGNQATTDSSKNLTAGSVNLQNNTSQPSGSSGSSTDNLQNTTPVPSTNYTISVN